MTASSAAAVYDRLFALVDDWNIIDRVDATHPDALRLLTTEARLLDDRRHDEWLATWADDGVLWVPLGRATHPGTDQSLFLDDVRRLRERIGRWSEPTAWSLQLQLSAVRQISNIEASETADGLLTVRSVATVFEHRGGALRIWPMHQYHLFTATADGRRLAAKVLVVPALAHAVPHSAVLL